MREDDQKERERGRRIERDGGRENEKRESEMVEKEGRKGKREEFISN